MMKIWNIITKTVGTITIFFGVGVILNIVIDIIKNRDNEVVDDMKADQCPYMIGDIE